MAFSMNVFSFSIAEFTSKSSCLDAAKQTNIAYIWGLPSDTKNIDKYECLVGVDPIVCKKAPYSR